MLLECRWQGSVHDSTIFAQSMINARLQSGEFEWCYLLGDAGYACKSCLLTPLAAPATAEEMRYNRSHIHTRNTVERCFGVVKRR